MVTTNSLLMLDLNSDVRHLRAGYALGTGAHVALDLYIGGLFLHTVAHDSLDIHKVQTLTSRPARLKRRAAAIT